MADLLTLVDQLIGSILQGNIYSDTSQYREKLPAQPQQIPGGAYGGIPNADPRRLVLNAPVGFAHAHDPLASQAPAGRRNAQGVPVIPGVMHDTVGIYTDPTTGIIQGNKRQGFYTEGPPPLDVSQQTANLASNSPPPPSEQARRLSRGEIYGAGGQQSYGQPIPGGSISTAPTRTPLSIRQQRQRLEVDETPPPQNGQIGKLTRRQIYAPPPPGPVPQGPRQQQQNLDNDTPPPPGTYWPTAGPTDQTIRQLNRGEIYGPSATPPQNIDQQYQNLDNDTPPPPGTYWPTQGPTNQTIRQLRRTAIYGGPPPPSPDGGQKQALRSDTPPPPGAYMGGETPTATAKGPEDKTVHQLTRPEIYASDGQPSRNLGPASSLQALVDFHESKTRPFSPTQTAERRFDVNSPDSKIPQNPNEAGPSQIKGSGLDKSSTVNEFASVPLRPLNFQGQDDAPDRKDLVSANHPQHFGWNASGLEPAPQNRGIISDNLYSDSDVPFEGRFPSSFHGAVPPFLNYFNIIATGHWLRNIGKELFVADIEQGIQGGQTPSQEPSSDGRPNIAERAAKGITFASTQLLLAGMNPWNPNFVGGPANAIWNPLSIAAAVPLVGTFPPTNITLGAAAAGIFGAYQSNVQILDDAGASRMLLARQGLHEELSPIHRLSKLQSPISAPGFIGDTVGTSGDTLDSQTFPPTTFSTIQAQVDGGLDTEAVAQLGIHTNLYNEGRQYKDNALFPLEKAAESARQGSNPGAEKISNLFDPKSRKNNAFVGFSNATTAGLGTSEQQASILADWVAKPRTGVTDGFSATSMADAPGINAAVVPAGLPGEVTEKIANDQTRAPDGTIDKPIADSDIYMPFVFQDLRDPEEKHLYFRAFLKDLNETFIPEWQTERFYGRVDMVPIYKGTNRTLNVSFDVAAFQLSDLSVIYNKLNKLQSMVYPFYDLRGFYEQGPLIRLRIGDLFAGSGKGGVARGLPGYISAMDWTFPSGIWEIEKDFKVPRHIAVAMSFNVIHDGNPGTYRKAHYELDKYGNEQPATQNPDNANGAPAERIFGAGRFTKPESGGNTVVDVSRAEIRRIFDSVRN